MNWGRKEKYIVGNVFYGVAHRMWDPSGRGERAEAGGQCKLMFVVK
jgi:hypothetical protein